MINMAERLSVLLLFSKNKKTEPEAVIRSDSSNELFQHIFNDWRYAVHFIKYYKTLELSVDEAYDKWESLYMNIKLTI